MRFSQRNLFKIVSDITGETKITDLQLWAMFLCLYQWQLGISMVFLATKVSLWFRCWFPWQPKYLYGCQGNKSILIAIMPTTATQVSPWLPWWLEIKISKRGLMCPKVISDHLYMVLSANETVINHYSYYRIIRRSFVYKSFVWEINFFKQINWIH